MPPIDGAFYWNSNKRDYDWRTANSRNQTLFRIMLKLGTNNKPALQQSNWPLLDDFLANVGQHPSPLPPERRPYDTQLLNNVAESTEIIV